MAQVGDAYVYGATGDNAFDCSGLTMRAWGAAGVGLPHSSSAQYGSGPHVSASDLQPGDLVFYYSPISHVGMYIGNGLIVHAANPGTGVAVSRSLLHALRRRGSPWLIARPRRPVAHVWWVAGLSLCVGRSRSVWWLAATSPTGRRRRRPEGCDRAGGAAASPSRTWCAAVDSGDAAAAAELAPDDDAAANSWQPWSPTRGTSGSTTSRCATSTRSAPSRPTAPGRQRST